MPGFKGLVTAGGGLNAHEKMLDAIESNMQSAGWTTLRKSNGGDNTPNGKKYELIMKGRGLSGAEEIYLGFQCYQSVDSDYYNISFSGFTGYLPANSFDAQPAAEIKSVCAHNQRIDYWMFCDGQGIAFLFKVGTPVYESGYVGKAYPYSSPGQYPYPMLAIGTLDGRPSVRFSDTQHASGLRGYNDGIHTKISLRLNDGTWFHPATTIRRSLIAQMRDTTGKYHPSVIQLCTEDGTAENTTVQSDIYGLIPHFKWITGFNNITENVFTDEAGKSWIVFQDVFRNGIGDYYALETTP